MAGREGRENFIMGKVILFVRLLVIHRKQQEFIKFQVGKLLIASCTCQQQSSNFET